MRYLVLQGDSYTELEMEVNRQLLMGWQLQGGVCVVFMPSYQLKFFQAMVSS